MIWNIFFLFAYNSAEFSHRWCNVMFSWGWWCRSGKYDYLTHFHVIQSFTSKIKTIIWDEWQSQYYDKINCTNDTLKYPRSATSFVSIKCWKSQKTVINVIIALARVSLLFLVMPMITCVCDLANDKRVWIGSSLMIFITRWLTNNMKYSETNKNDILFVPFALCNQVWVFRTESTNLDDIIWFNLVEGVGIGYRWRKPFDEKGRILRLIDA